MRATLFVLHVLLAVLPGCLFIGDAAYLEEVDLDGDGHVGPAFGGLDCAEGDPNIHPDAPDIPYDGIDSDCDGANDFDADGDGLTSPEFGGTDCDDTDPGLGDQVFPWYADCDGDGAFSDVLVLSCTLPTDLVCDGGPAAAWTPVRPEEFDCDDTSDQVAPGNPDPFYDGLDANCDGANDFDRDGDGYVAADVPGAVPSPTAPDIGDCDDENPFINPGVAEVWYDGTDQNCDGVNDFDRDGDTYVREGDGSQAGGTAPRIGDCDDDDFIRNPGAEETFYDGADADCDGANDYDADGDGVVPLEWAAMAGSLAVGDCDDADPERSPLRTEVFYDGRDGDCDEANDFDADGDGYVVGSLPGFTDAELSALAGGTAPGTGDCDDTVASAFPGAVDVPYDGTDSDCGGDSDYDADGDGFEAPHIGLPPALADCDDTRTDVFPDAPDAPYDGVDSDCDGANDYDADGDGAVESIYSALAGLPGGDCADDDPRRSPLLDEVWYDGIDGDCGEDHDFDQDGDGFVAEAFGAFAGGLQTGDCDDLTDTTNPDASDFWYDGVDSDCDGANDYDQDGDGAVWLSYPGTAGGTAPTEGDCDDLQLAIGPLAPEIWNDGIDSDCDGANDYDQDGDGYVGLGFQDQTTPDAPGVGDCDDLDGSINPGADEVLYDLVDQDCDGAHLFDVDGDGFVAAAFPDFAGGTAPGTGDCDDLDPTVNPGSSEVWYDGVDSDCDGANDYDQDGDAAVAAAYAGTQGGSAPLVGDCDDLNADRGPGAKEIWYDGVDQDCDGIDNDQDGDGTEWPEDCDDLDPTRYLTFANAGPADDVRALLAAACDDAQLTLQSGTYLVDAPWTTTADRVRIVGSGAVTVDGAGATGLIAASSDLRLANLVLTGGSAVNGGCISVSGSLTLTDSTVRGCTASNRGGGLYVGPTGSVDIEGTVFEDNVAVEGADLALDGGTASLFDVTFRRGQATDGGAIHGVDATLGNAALLDFVDSAATQDGGAVHLTDTELFASSWSITTTSAGDTGGAVYFDGVGGSLTDLDVDGAVANGPFFSISTDPEAAILAVFRPGATGGIFTLERVDVRNSAAYAGLDVYGLSGLVRMHDIDVRMAGSADRAVGVRNFEAEDAAYLQMSNVLAVGGRGAFVHFVHPTVVADFTNWTVVGWQQPNQALTFQTTTSVLTPSNFVVANQYGSGAAGLLDFYFAEQQYRIRYMHVLADGWQFDATEPPPYCDGCTRTSTQAFDADYRLLPPLDSLPGDPDACVPVTGSPCATALQLTPGYWGGPEAP